MLSWDEADGQHEISGLVCLKSEGELISQIFIPLNQGMIVDLIFEGCKESDRPNI